MLVSSILVETGMLHSRQLIRKVSFHRDRRIILIKLRIDITRVFKSYITAACSENTGDILILRGNMRITCL